MYLPPKSIYAGEQCLWTPCYFHFTILQFNGVGVWYYYTIGEDNENLCSPTQSSGEEERGGLNNRQD